MVAVDGLQKGTSGQSFGEWQLGVIEPQTQRAHCGVAGKLQAFECVGDSLVSETVRCLQRLKDGEHFTAFVVCGQQYRFPHLG